MHFCDQKHTLPVHISLHKGEHYFPVLIFLSKSVDSLVGVSKEKCIFMYK